jgi:hypothetical protein
LKLALTIALTLTFVSIYGQDAKDICNCLKTPIECVPEISKRKIVSNDTMIAHHSYCFEIFSSDENRSAVVVTYLCNEKPKDSFLLSFFDPRTLGDRAETWYDTSGRFIYNTFSKNNIVTECYWYHYPPNQKNYDYTIGYKGGELFKEIYIWDEYGASYKQRIIITAKSITTILHTDERDQYGNYIQKSSTMPNKTGKIE